MIYHMALKTIIQHIYPSVFSIAFKKLKCRQYYSTIWVSKDSIKLVFADGYKKRFYPIQADFMVDYDK